MINKSCLNNARFDCLPHIDMASEIWTDYFSLSLVKISDIESGEKIKKRMHYYCSKDNFKYKLISPLYETDFHNLPPILIVLIFYI